GALADRLDGAFDRSVAGDDDDAEVVPALVDLPCQAQTVGARDLQVDDAERVLVLFEKRERIGSRPRAVDLVVPLAEQVLELAADQRIVIDDENALSHPYTLPAIGSSSVSDDLSPS